MSGRLWPEHIHASILLARSISLSYARSQRTVQGRLPLALEVTGGAHEGDALVHDDLANPQVVVKPLLHILRLADSLGFDTRSTSPGKWRVNVSHGMLCTSTVDVARNKAKKGEGVVWTMLGLSGQGGREGMEGIREAGGALDASQEGRNWIARSENNEGPVTGGKGMRTEDGVEGVVGQSSELM